MQRLAVPDMTNDPEGLANRLIWDAGYSDSQVDADRAAEGARWRERLGPELGGLLVAANRRLRAERRASHNQIRACSTPLRAPRVGSERWRSDLRGSTALQSVASPAVNGRRRKKASAIGLGRS